MRAEKHRLTTLQKQILRWLRDEGGGVLPLTRIFTNTQQVQVAYTDVDLLCARLSEAIEQLCRSGHAEVRDDSQPRPKKPLSIYDFGSLSQYLQAEDDGSWRWTKGECPVVALSDSGALYVAKF